MIKNKKIIIGFCSIFIIGLILAIFFFTKGNSNRIELQSNVATFMVDGKEYSKVALVEGHLEYEPDEPYKENYTFQYWTVDGKKYNSGDEINSASVFEAVFIENSSIINVESVSLDKSSVSIAIGESIKLNATISPLDATNKKILWISSNSEVATVDETGTIIGTGNGTTLIIASSQNGKEAECEVKVSGTEIQVSGIDIGKKNLKINVNDTAILDAIIAPISATNKNVIWKSSDTKVATIDSTGKVKGVGKGSAVITVTSSNGKTASTEIVVSDVRVDATKIAFSEKSSTLDVGNKIKLNSKITFTPSNVTNNDITWTSSNSNIVKVSTSGEINAVKSGTAEITATSSNGKTATFTVVVNENSNVILAAGITLNHKTLSVANGDKTTLIATISPDNVTDKSVTWTSSNSESVVVDNNGLITAKSVGKSTITVTTSNGKTASCIVTVVNAVNEGEIRTVNIMNETVKGYFNSSNYVGKVIEYCNEKNCSKLENLSWPNTKVTDWDGNIYLYDYDETTKTRMNKRAVNSDRLANYLIPGKAYYLRKDDLKEYIKVEDNSIRMIKANNVANVRDIGGFSASGGKIKYGKIYRGANPNKYAKASTKIFKEIGIDYIVDLRKTNTDKEHITEITSVVRGVDSYKANDEYRAAVREIMKSIVNNKTVYFHCEQGKDRTGTVAYLLEGILGVDENSRMKDYELSYFANPKPEKMHHDDLESRVKKEVKKTYSETEAERFINWYLSASSDIKTDVKLINDFREKMIDGNPKKYVYSPEKVHFIKQGGDAILLESNGHYALVDTGVPTGEEPCQPLADYLTSNNVEKLDFVLISHMHNDHAGCIQKVFNTVQVDKIYYKFLYEKSPSLKFYTENFLPALENAKNNGKINDKNIIDVTQLKEGYKISLGDMTLKLYHTIQRMDKFPWNKKGDDYKFYRNENQNSILTLLTVNNIKTFLTGDMEDYNIMKEYVPSKINNVKVMKLPHHGIGKEEDYDPDNNKYICSLNKDLVDSLSPSYLVATDGEKKTIGKDSEYSCLNKGGFDVSKYPNGSKFFAVQAYDKGVVFDYSFGKVLVTAN